ncbi:hypothetical protein COV53_06095 [Candidatus Gottesmanbacteria bacterium CG11_big_fil_rev_8_21_14_0_20_37_11]|uniref:MBL fold metallo-hydrolase n=2 Tax=Candidatus Gottesmaniibacteriota TaxID=1752720 RepID=A0A2M7RQE3_9BACT|nr:MAG: hypothetical protein COX23_01910 [Candidatus Gottesmanbacteria bacterium CG23_combo_of_CG06-09_8_20_14_all_37_19]PIR07871.1 MAG: hypothetical protein COV53_06095 [Candidatus Gottesmanbacteria bacterium CG11_big_fil_rev_8_21_14_0_20_37_11]PIZ02390.1 MAG: hypothetical protein COY59_05245 [Candidatus Gottesmanbacteria bacterium CG_4_10_14_0_8_um_filter_37_24]
MSISIKYFPHSWFQIKTKDIVLYIDPAWVQSYFNNYPKKVIFSHYPEPMDGLPEEDLEKADLILITHHHKDHQKKATVERLSKKDTVVIGTKKCVTDLGKIKVITPNDVFEVKGIQVKAINSYNTINGSSTKKVHNKGECNSYVIRLEGKAIYHAGDTDFIPEMKELGKIDVALLPIGGRFTMNIDEAVEASLAIHSRIVIPMHFLESDPQEFKSKLESKSYIKVVVLNTGETYILK